MEQLKNWIANITSIEIIDVIIAIGIIIFFRIFSAGMAYVIIKMFKWKEKSKKKIKESAFYRPLRLFFILLGFYLAILFYKYHCILVQMSWNG